MLAPMTMNLHLNMNMKASLHPHLVVAGADRAIAFYVEALAARELERYADPNLGGRIVHARLDLGGALLTLSEEDHAFDNDAPTSLGGSGVLLTLEVADATAVGARMERAGAKVIFPIADQFYGRREGRLLDPFGHRWVITQPLLALEPREIQRRIEAGEY
jgi:PhnB protein